MRYHRASSRRVRTYLHAGRVPPEQLVATRHGQRAVAATRFGPYRADRVVTTSGQTRVLPGLVTQTFRPGSVHVDSTLFRVRPDRTVAVVAVVVRGTFF